MGRTRSIAVGAIITLALVGCSSNREISTESPASSDDTTETSAATPATDDPADTTTTLSATTTSGPPPESTTTLEPPPTVDPSSSVPPVDTTGTTTTTTAAPPPVYGTPEAPIIVLSGVGLLGWWDGSSWVYGNEEAPDVIPVAVGTEFTTFSSPADVGTATATGVDLGCEQLGTYTVVLDPPVFYGDDAKNFAVNASWNLFPRPVNELDTSNAEYVEIVRQQLIADGLPDPNVQIDQLLLTDLEGDGTDEVLIAASHPDLDLGRQTVAGWFSIVMIRQVSGADVRTTVLAEDIHLTDGPEEQSPNGAQFGLDTVADFNGDGRSEVTVWASYWEGASETIYDVAPGAAPVLALQGGCGS